MTDNFENNKAKQCEFSNDVNSQLDNESSPADQYRLGLALLVGDGVEADKERAVELLSSSAKADYHEMTRPALELLINIYIRERNNDELIGLYNKLIKYLTDTQGKDCVEALDYQVKLALCYDAKRERKVARSLMSEAYERKYELLGKNDPSTVRTLCAKLQLYSDPDETATFLDMAIEAGAGLDIVKDIDSPDVLNALYNYARAFDAFYGYSALYEYEAIREWVLKFRGKGSDDDLNILSELADIYYEHELYEEAIKLGEEFCSYVAASHGAEDDYTLAICENLAKVFFFTEDYTASLSRLENVAKHYEKQGRDAHEMAAIYYNMALCYHKNGDDDAAIKNLQHCHELCEESKDESTDLEKYVSSFMLALQNKGARLCLLLRWRNVWAMIQ